MQELFYKFVDRDVERAGIEKVGYGAGDKTQKWISETQPLYEKWGEEFEKHGIGRLEVVRKK